MDRPENQEQWAARILCAIQVQDRDSPILGPMERVTGLSRERLMDNLLQALMPGTQRAAYKMCRHWGRIGTDGQIQLTQPTSYHFDPVPWQALWLALANLDRTGKQKLAKGYELVPRIFGDDQVAMMRAALEPDFCLHYRPTFAEEANEALAKAAKALGGRSRKVWMV